MKLFTSVLAIAFFAYGFSASAQTYVGKFNGVAGVLTLQAANQTYTASFTGNNGQKGFLKGCESSVGRLLKYKEKNGVLRQLLFAFNPNYCVSVQGRDVQMDFKNSKVEVSILSHTEQYQPPCIPDWQGHQNCPFPEYRPVYFYGKFTRQ